MKKLITLMALLLMCLCNGTQAADVSDLETISENLNIYFADYITDKVNAGTLFANDYLFSPKANNYATNKGTDKTISKLYCCRVKSKDQDPIAFKVSGACTLVIYADRITDRTPFLNDKMAAKTAGDNSIDGETTATDGKKGYATYDIPAAGTYYIIGNGSDCFLAGLEFTFAPAKTPTGETLKSAAAVKVDNTALTLKAATNGYSVDGTTITLSDDITVLSAPSNIKIVKTISYDDESSEDEDVVVSFDGTITFGYFIGTATIGETAYTVRVKQNKTPTAMLSATSGSIAITNSYTVIGTTTVTLTGGNLTDGTYDVTSDVEGTTISPASFTIADGIVNQEFTITSSASSAATTVFTFGTDAIGVTAPTFTLSYSKVAQNSLSQVNVTEATTWDWTKAGENTIELTASTSPANNEEFLMANLPEVKNDENFNSQALLIATQYPTRGTNYYFQGYSIKFNTTVAGTIDVTFSNTGKDRPYRYLRVNGEQTEYRDAVGTMVEAKGIAVPAGEVVIDFYIPDAADPVERPADVVGTTMCRVKKIVFTPTVTIPVSAAGYATFYTDKALDFTNIENITAYTATKEGNVVKFNKVTSAVPALTGLLVKADEGNYPIPVAASGEGEKGIMLGTLTGETIEDGSFVLLNQNNVIGFYRATGFTARPNSAWLPSTVAGSSVRFIGFDDEGGEATGIQEVSTATMKSEQVFNLRGQRVAAPQNGLYIVNGKKVVLK